MCRLGDYSLGVSRCPRTDVHQCVGEGDGWYSRRNLHHTDHIQSDTQHKYPDSLINSTIAHFVTSVTSRDTLPTPQTENIHRIVLPFKDQRSADMVKKHLSDLSNKIDHILQPVFSSRKLSDDLKVQEPKPPLINQQCVVNHFVI